MRFPFAMQMCRDCAPETCQRQFLDGTAALLNLNHTILHTKMQTSLANPSAYKNKGAASFTF
jgi:hypothetical protein